MFSGRERMWTSFILLVVIIVVPQFVYLSNNEIQRLITDIIPTRYTIRLDVKLHPQFDFHGNVRLILFIFIFFTTYLIVINYNF